MEVLKLPLHTVLSTYTEGQLKLIAIASLVQYRNTKDEIESDKNKSPTDNKKRKSFKDMNKDEIEAYYRSQGLT